MLDLNRSVDHIVNPVVKLIKVLILAPSSLVFLYVGFWMYKVFGENSNYSFDDMIVRPVIILIPLVIAVIDLYVCYLVVKDSVWKQISVYALLIANILSICYTLWIFYILSIQTSCYNCGGAGGYIYIASCVIFGVVFVVWMIETLWRRRTGSHYRRA